MLLLITDLQIGGTPVVVRELATRLAPYAHVEVACLKPAGPVADQLRERGVTVTSFEVRHLYEFRRATNALVRLMRERKIDVLMSFLVHANFIAARACRRLPDVRCLQSIQTAQPRPRWHWWVQERIHERAARIVVPSESVALRAIERSDVPPAKIAVVPNAIDVEAYERIRPRAPDGLFRVGFVGRLDPVKRVPDLVQAVGELPEHVRLEIYGDGAARPQVESAIAHLRMGSRVTLHGMVDDPKIAYANVDALVLPSEAEGFGLVLIEAMASGVPVIGTDVDGIRDVVGHEETGLLVPPADPLALASAIRRLIDDLPLRQRLIEDARHAVVREYAWGPVIDRYRELMQLN